MLFLLSTYSLMTLPVFELEELTQDRLKWRGLINEGAKQTD